MSATNASFPAGFFWGSATSAHQVEGGNRWNDWWRFERQPGAIHENQSSGEACRHYQLFDQDFSLAEADGHNAHRLSIEWSRIEPERGRISAEAVAHYHAVLESLARRKLTPLVTLHHFTNPLWIADQGGWESRATVDRFGDFVSFCAREFGSEVDWWCTVNEPEVFAFHGWSEGVWPPRKRDDGLALEVIANQLEAHGRAYRILHAEDRVDGDGDGRAAVVGFAKHYTPLESDRWWFPLDALRARLEDAVFNEAVLRAPVSGEIRLSIPGARAVRRHVPELAGAFDYVGLNYYTRWMVRASGPKIHVARAGAPVTDLGWEIHPAGLEAAIRRVGPLGKPILITEHGYADATDRWRPRVLLESLIHVRNAIASGSDVRGFFYWSLMDNFEWADGYRARFGLYRVDFDDPGRRRERTRTADVYSRIARANAIDPALVAEVGLAL